MSSTTWNNRIAALALGLGLAMATVIGPCWWSIVRYHNPSCSAYKPDFISLYTGAKLMQMDRASLYNLEQQRLVQEPIDPSRGAWVLPYFYPPFFAVVLMPLAWMSFSMAFVAMTLINLILLIVAIKILIARLRLNRQQANWLVLTTFCNYRLQYALLQGQTSFIALLLLSLFVTGFNGSAGLKAGIWPGLLLFKPQLAFVPFLILFCRKRWRALGVAAVIAVVLAAVSCAAIGWDGLGRYLDVSRRAMTGDDYLHIRPERMHNFRALLYFFSTARWREYLWWLATAAVMAMVVMQSKLDRTSRDISLVKWISILIGIILISPHLHDHDLTLLSILSACFLKLAGDSVPPFISLGLVGLGMLAFVNTLAYPHLPPLLPLALLVVLFVNLQRQRGLNA